MRCMCFSPWQTAEAGRSGERGGDEGCSHPVASGRSGERRFSVVDRRSADRWGGRSRAGSGLTDGLLLLIRPSGRRGVAQCRLFVVVFVFASEQAEEREADQRGEKAQAHQRGCGRRRGSEVEDGHHQRQRDNDFQEVGHGVGRVCCAARNTAAAIACLLVYRFTCLLVSPVDSLTGPRVYSSTGSLVYLFPRRPVCGSTGLLVYLFTCLLVPASTR